MCVMVLGAGCTVRELQKDLLTQLHALNTLEDVHRIVITQSSHSQYTVVPCLPQLSKATLRLTTSSLLKGAVYLPL